MSTPTLKETQLKPKLKPKPKKEKPPPLNRQQLAFALLLKQGLPIQTASELAGFNSRYGYQLEKDIKKKKYDLTSEKWIAKAEKALECVIEGGIVGKASKPKTSDVMRAVEMVYDRAQPIVHRAETVSVNATIDLVDLTKYKRGGDISVDIEPTSVQAESET